MKIFYGILCLMAAIALAAPQVASQGMMHRGGGGMGRGMMNQTCVPGVTLTADQQSKIAAIRQETQSKVASIMSNSSLSSAQKQAQAQAARQAGHQKVLDVLTPQQLQQFQSNWRMGCPMGTGGGRGMGPGMMNQGYVPGVTLTADQQSKIAAIRQETQSKVASIMSDSSLSAAQKQAQAQAARQAGHDKVLDVLTPEQRQQFDQNWGSMSGQGMMGPGMGRMMPGTQSQPATGDAPPPGKAIFAQNCAQCHGADGNAITGWKTRVGKMTLTDIQTTVKNGKDGMPAFKNTLTEEQIEQVASYAKSLGAKSK